MTTPGDDQREHRAPAQRRGATRLTRLLSASPAPVIAEPSCCGVTVCGSNVADQPAAQDHLDACRRGRSARRGRRRSAARRGPRRRASRMSSQIAAWAPTSTPRVGCEATSRTGSPLISRPTMNFCWLPPDSARAVVSMPGVRTSYCSTIRSASSRAPLRSTSALDGRLPRSGDRGCGSPTAASRAADRAAAGPRGCSRRRPRDARGSPSRSRPRRGARRAPAGRRMPITASTSSVWPLPSTPAMPSTSPAWMTRSMSVEHGAAGRVVDRQVAHLEEHAGR